MSEEKKDMIAEAVELLKAANEEEVYAQRCDQKERRNEKMDNQTGCNPAAEDRIIALIRSAKDPQRAMAIAVERLTREAARNANQPQIDALPIR